MNINIKEVNNSIQLKIIKELFQEYEKALGVDLCFQGFQKELNSLPDKYSRPDGCIFLACVDNKPTGCVALRKKTSNICEMKRLYIKPKFRSLGLEKRLTEKIIEEAKIIGYKNMRLDTLSRLEPAINLYKSFGFIKTELYYLNPIEDVIYMELDL